MSELVAARFPAIDAVAAIDALPWCVCGAIASPVRGHRGAHEFLVHAARVTYENFIVR